MAFARGDARRATLTGSLENRGLVLTDRNLHLVKCGYWKPAKPKKILTQWTLGEVHVIRQAGRFKVEGEQVLVRARSMTKKRRASAEAIEQSVNERAGVR